MFAEFFKRLTQATPDTVSHDDARLALSALLVRIALADGEYAHEEADMIDRVLRDRYGLSPFEAAELRKQAETVAATIARAARRQRGDIAFCSILQTRLAGLFHFTGRTFQYFRIPHYV